MRTYVRVLRLARHEWRGLVSILGLGLGFSLAAALQPWPLQFLVDHALASPSPELAPWLTWLDGGAPRLVVVAAVASLFVFACETALEIGLTRTWARVGRRLVHDLGAELFGRLQRLSLGFHARRSTGDALARVHEDSWCVYTLTEALLVAPLQHSITVVLLGVIAWRLDPRLAASALVLAPALALLALFFGRRLEARAQQFREADAGVFSFVREALGAIPVVQAFGMRAAMGRRFRNVTDEVVRTEQREAFWKALFSGVGGIVLAAGAAVILLVGGQRVLAGAISIGTLLVFLGYLHSLESASRSLLGIYGTARAAGASAARVLEVLDAADEVAEPPAPRPLPPVRGRGRHVRFEHVCFGYAPGRLVLDDLDLDLFPGEAVALVGRTGAGKSTLAALLPRFYDPWNGRITLDGVDVRDLRLSDLRGDIAIVPQDPLLFPVSIAENIAYGRPGSRAAEIFDAARAAHAHQFIEALPAGYDTVLGERGTRLSGGERQRLAIARALLKDAPVLILDEPTSALDAGVERLLLDALRALFAGRTVLVIAHRFSTLHLADRVAVLDAGRIAELGTEAELRGHEGLYSQLRGEHTAGEVAR